MTEEVSLPVLIGREITRCRKLARLSQTELAMAFGASASQLCKIEKGCHLPNNSTLANIEKALNLAPGKLTNIRNNIVIPDQTPMSMSGCLLETKRTEDLTAKDIDALKRSIAPILDEYSLLERELHLDSFTRINCYGQLISINDADASILAHVVRNSLGVGTAPIPDLLPLLESQNIRVIFTKLLTPKVHSKSFLDNARQNLVICLYERSTPERQLCDLAMEIAYACIYVRRNTTALADTKEFCSFARTFAREFLMPRTGLRALMEYLSIDRDDWTLPLINNLKSRFGVSAQLFLFQLQHNTLITPECFARVDLELNDYYQSVERKYGANTRAYLENIEPEPRRAPLPHDSWLAALRTRAKNHTNRQ